MESESPYFYIDEKFELSSLEQIFDLAKVKTYGILGQIYDANKHGHYVSSYQTNGLFRGQSKNWPLIPSAYREIGSLDYNDSKKIEFHLRYIRALHDFTRFRKLAAQQNRDFPNSIAQQMVIAQHYGVKTPLLDWTKNVFVAIYFAVDFWREDRDQFELDPIIFHVRDERFFGDARDIERKPEEQEYSLFIEPNPLDRRIDRQFSKFSFHPFPQNNVKKIPVDLYEISANLLIELIDLLNSLGFTSSHYFPDYAGLAERIKLGYI